MAGEQAARAQLRTAVHFLCEGKTGAHRGMIIDEILAAVRAIGRGDPMADCNDVISFDLDEVTKIEGDLGANVVGYLRDRNRQMLQELLAGAQYMKAPLAKIRLLEELLAEPLKHIPDDAPEAVRESAMRFLGWFYKVIAQPSD